MHIDEKTFNLTAAAALSACRLASQTTASVNAGLSQPCEVLFL